MKEEIIKIYKTIDGKIFENKDDALEYEERFKNKQYYLVFAFPDLTEGRHDGKCIGYIFIDKIDLSWSNNPIDDIIATEYAEVWCQNHINGIQYSFVSCGFHKGTPAHNWKVKKISNDELEKEYIKNYSLLGFVDGSGTHDLRK